MVLHVDERLKAPAEFAILYVHLDRLNAVNDRYGRENGDLVLRSVAARLSALLPDRGYVGRISGDEFLAVLPALETDDEPEQLARAIVTNLMDPVHVGEFEIVSPAQVGIARGPVAQPDLNQILTRRSAGIGDRLHPLDEHFDARERPREQRLNDRRLIVVVAVKK